MAGPLNRDMRAIVRPRQAMEHFTLDRWDPAPALAPFVDRFWKTSWDLPEPFVQTIVSHPVVNLVFQSDGTATVSGVHRDNDQRELSGSGWALGVMFRAAGFRPFLDGPVSRITDRRVRAADVFGDGANALTTEVLSADADDARLALISAFLVERATMAGPDSDVISTLVESVVDVEPAITKVSELAARHGVSVRTLQRLFENYVGISPKWVLDRLRLHAAAERARHPVASWADVAQSLGYADQAHLTAALSATFGAPPASYARGESVES